jgi:hypothetical protein
MQDEEEKTSIHRPHKPATDHERTVVAGAPRQVARLRATLEDGMQTFLPLTATAVALTIGRDPSCGWYLQDLSVSRKHATIRWSGIALSIEDHGSSGGTFVGTRTVGATPCLVRPGDSVRVGDAIFILELTSQASGEVEQTRMISKPHSMSGAVTPAPSRPRAGSEPARPLGDDDATAAEVSLPAVVVAAGGTDDARLPVPEARPSGHAKSAAVAQARPLPPTRAVAPPKPAAQARPATPPRPVAPPVVEAEQQTTEAEIPLPEAVQPWNAPRSARPAEVKTHGEVHLPAVQPRAVAADLPRTEAEIHLPAAQQRTATHAIPANQQATEAQILLPEAKPRATAQQATEAEIRLPEAAPARPAAVSAAASLRARDPAHDPPVYVPERDVLAPGEDTRSWALETALAKPAEGLFGTRRSAVKSGMPVKKGEGKAPAASSSTRRRILLLAGPALLAIVTTASAWSQGPEAGPAQQKAAATAGPQAPVRSAAARSAATAARESAAAATAREPAAATPPTMPDRAANGTAGAMANAAAGSDAQAGSAAQDELLAGAIRAYSDGNRAEAMGIFRRIGNGDPTARAMVHIITLQASEAQ